MFHTYIAPQTEDGWITETSDETSGEMIITVAFSVPAEVRNAELLAHARFACRSRIARLGIDIRPVSDIQIEGATASLRASVRATVPQYQIHDLLHRVLIPGIRVGRLVICDPGKQLSSKDVYEEYSDNSFKLPAGFSIDAQGKFTIRPHRVVYDLHSKPSVEDLLAILSRSDGKSLLNRLQVARQVDNILLGPGEGIITSCTMFLHRHFVVLESAPTALGRHMHAVVLDPIATRGPRIFLEFFNDTSNTIVNPSAVGSIFVAEQIQTKKPTWTGMIDGSTHIDTTAATSEYLRVSKIFAEDRVSIEHDSYFDRPVAVVAGPLTDVESDSPREWARPVVADSSALAIRVAQSRLVSDDSCVKSFGTRIVSDLPDGFGGTVILRHFPNLGEHLDIAAAAANRKIDRLIFQKASFEHGPFLSARDHARLVDYADLGIEVVWCNDLRRHLAVHVFRGHRGFFCEIDAVDGFKNSLVVAVYGSSRPLPSREADKLSELIRTLRNFFGEDLAILTGGGPGAMQQASRSANSLGLLVGASYLEIEDQQTNMLADFYQVFQENCRHSRQRWFEIAGFHIFCIGGVGTLEEIGVTLTDIKLGISEGTPLVFFGRDGDDLYWAPLIEQLTRIAEADRGPEWLKSHVLMTDDPADVILFYRDILDLG